MSTLHITNGDCAAGTLRTFLTDRVMVTCDVLHDGPAPPVDGDAWHDVRARFLAGAFDAAFDDTRAGLMAFDRTVTENGRFDEIVLWFEHDLFDQLLLIRTLDLLVRLKPDPTYRVGDGGAPYVGSSTSGVGDISESYVGSGFSRTDVSMICIGDFPGVDRFIGLGQLNADQLASLLPDRKRVTPEQFALASKAWQAFRADDPSALHALMVRLKPDPTYNTGADDTLPFLHGAIHRLFEEYPSTRNGLSRSAHATLHALDSGPLDAGALFPATQADEPRPFMGDLGHFDIVRALATARVPLVTIDPRPTAPDLRGHTVSITDTGRSVLTGRADAVALNGIDEWRGGVHLSGIDRSPWRWDPERETLVS